MALVRAVNEMPSITDLVTRFAPGNVPETVALIQNAIAAGRQGMNLVNYIRNEVGGFSNAWSIIQGITNDLQDRGQSWLEMVQHVEQQLSFAEQTGWNQGRRNVAGAEAAENTPPRDMVRAAGTPSGNNGAIWDNPFEPRGPRGIQVHDEEMKVADNGNIVRGPEWNGGRNPVNSEGTPVRDVTTGGRPHNRNSEMGDSAGSVQGPEPEAAALRAGGGGGPNPVSKETPVSSYPSLTYGLQETHTTILPWVMWVGLALDKNATTPQQLKIRLNSMYDMIDNTIIAGAADDTLYTGPGFVNKKVGFNGKTPVTGNPFPVVPTAGALSTERPQWREYWAQIYQYYTVLGCEYEVIMVNPIGNYQQQNAGTTTGLCFGGDIICAEQVDTYSDTAAPTGNVMPLTTLVEVMNYKNIKWHKIEANGVGTNLGNTTIVKGRYTPGSVKRNIVNDGDVKTWTAMGSQPTLKEFLTLNFWPHPLSAGTHFGMNIQIRLKYIVQYKDLVAQARYPNSLNATGNVAQDIRNADTAANQILSDDVRQSIP